MSPNPLTPGLDFFKTCLSAFWKPEWKHGNVLKNGTILNYLAGILHPMHGLGVPQESELVSNYRELGCKIGWNLISDIVWASRVLSWQAACPVLCFYRLCDCQVTHFSDLANCSHPYNIAWQLYFLGSEGVEWSSRVSSSDQGLRKGKPSLRLQSGALQQRPNALQCMGGGTAKWELIIGDSSTSHPPSV